MARRTTRRSGRSANRSRSGYGARRRSGPSRGYRTRTRSFGARRSRSTGGHRTVRLVIETQHNPSPGQAVMLPPGPGVPHGFTAVQGEAPQTKPKF